jgi:hypothetical protein
MAGNFLDRRLQYKGKRTVTECEAVERANTYLLQLRGIEAKPVEVHLIHLSNSPSYWWISYGTAILYPKETAAGVIVDDGNFILRVDDVSGKVSEL